MREVTGWVKPSRTLERGTDDGLQGSTLRPGWEETHLQEAIRWPSGCPMTPTPGVQDSSKREGREQLAILFPGPWCWPAPGLLATYSSFCTRGKEEDVGL